jgi:choline dehydrogenase-like flavoprotein
VLTGAQVTRILFDGRRAVGVESSRAAARRELQARREVLLSAGALQSPHLLMLSGIGPGAAPAGTACGAARPARRGPHLHDHPDVVQVVDAPRWTNLFGCRCRRRDGACWAASSSGARQRTGMLTTNFAEAGGFIRSQPGEPVPDLQLHFVIGKLVDHGRKTVFGHGYSCHVCLLQPVSRGSVRLPAQDPLARR